MNFLWLKKYGFFLLSILLMVPLLWINLRNNYDWEGDTALMLNQAENIVKGENFTQTKFIYNPDYPILSPPYYPPVTPLMFAAIMKWAGYNILLLMILNSILYFLIGILTFRFIKESANAFAGIVGSVLLVYNQFAIRMKEEIMSDVPFTFFALLGIWIILRKDKRPWHWVFAGLISAIAVQTRSIGYAIPLSVGLYLLIISLQSKSYKENIINFFYFFSSWILIMTAFHFAFPANGISIYIRIFDDLRLTTIWENIFLYKTLITDFLVSPLNGWGIIALFVKWISLILILIGSIIALKKEQIFPLVFAIVYLTILIVYPYQSAGFRFLLPLAPFLILFFVFGIQWVLNRINNQLIGNILIGLFISLELIIAVKGNYYYQQSKTTSDIICPPTIEMLSAIEQITNEADIIQTAFPRIIAYYGQRNAFAINKKAGYEKYIHDLKKFHAGYVLISAKYSHPAEKEWVKKLNFPIVFDNQEYTLIKIRN